MLQSHKEPEETQQTLVLECSGPKTSRTLFPKASSTALRAQALSLALAGLSVSCPCHPLAHVKRKCGLLTPAAVNHVSFGKDTASLWVSLSPPVMLRAWTRSAGGLCVVCLLLPSFLSSVTLNFVVVFLFSLGMLRVTGLSVFIRDCAKGLSLM